MGAGNQLLKKALDAKTLTAGGIVAGSGLTAALEIPGILESQNKLAGLAKAAANVVKWNLFGWAGLTSAGFLGMRTTIRALIVDSGSLEAAMRRFSAVQVYTKQFAPFVGGVAQAKARIGELAKEAGKRWKFESLAEAQRNLAVFTRGAFAGRDALKQVDDAANATGNGIGEVSAKVGQLYAEMRDGGPVASTAEELANMGVITQSTAMELERMQTQGAPLSAMFARVQSDMQKAGQAADATGDSVENLQSRYEAARETLAANFGDAFLKSEQEGTKNTIAALENLLPVATAVAGPLSEVVTIGNNFETWIAKVVTSIPGLATGASIVTRAFIAFGAAMTAITAYRGLTVLVTLTPSLLEFARALMSGSVASDLAAAATTRLTTAKKLSAEAAALTMEAEAAEAAGDIALAVEKEALAAASTRQALAQTVAGRATGLLSSAVALLTTGMKKLMAATILNPWFLLVSAIVGLIAVSWHAIEAHSEHVKALNDLRDAGDGVVRSLRDQVAAMRTMDDQQQALIDSTNALAAARAKMAELKLEGHKNQELGIVRQQIAQIEAQRQAASRKQGLAPGREEQAALDAQARRDVDAKDAAFSGQMALASPEEQLKLREQRMAENAPKLEQGKTLALDRAHTDEQVRPVDTGIAGKSEEINAGEKALAEHSGKNVTGYLAKQEADERDKLMKGGMDAEKATAQARESREWKTRAAAKYFRENNAKGKSNPYQNELDMMVGLDATRRGRSDLEKQRSDVLAGSANPYIAGEEQVRRDLAAKKITPAQAEERRAKLRTGQYDVEQKYDSRVNEQNQLKTDQTQATRQRDNTQIELDAEKDIAALRSKGMDAAEAEARIRIAALQKQLDTETYLGDQQKEALQNRIDGENKALALMREQAAIQREADAEHLAIVRLSTRETEATTQGRFGEAGRARQERIRREDAQANRESYNQKIQSGQYTEAQARQEVAAEQAQREEEREADRRAYKAQQDRALTEEELANDRNPETRRDSRARLRKMKDVDKFRERVREGQEHNLTPQEAYENALRAGQDDVHKQFLDSDRNQVADSLARVGGGGGVFAGDPKAEEKRMVELLDAIRQELANNGTEDKDLPLVFKQ